jgi:hypothetical protein
MKGVPNERALQALQEVQKNERVVSVLVLTRSPMFWKNAKSLHTYLHACVFMFSVPRFHPRALRVPPAAVAFSASSRLCLRGGSVDLGLLGLRGYDS